MSRTQQSAAKAAKKTDYIHGVAHVWLHTRRSLCDLAAQVATDDAEAINAVSEDAPTCGACIAAADVLLGTVLALTARRKGISPARPATAVADLVTTGWQWVLSPNQAREVQSWFTYREEYTS